MYFLLLWGFEWIKFEFTGYKMRRICIYQEAVDASSHYIEQDFKGEGFVPGSFGKFIPIVGNDKLILIHAFCSSAIKSKHSDCCYKYDYDSDYGKIYCCLAPQVKITGVLYLNNEAQKSMFLQSINEPYCIYNKDNEKMLYSCIAKKCDKDSVTIFNKDVFVGATCPACHQKDCLINTRL